MTIANPGARAVQGGVRVAIADDSLMIRKALGRVIKGSDGMQLIGEAADGDQALDLVARAKPDVLILDLEMPGKGGIEVLETLKQLGSRTRVVVFSAASEAQISASIKALRSGAVELVQKPSNGSLLTNLAKIQDALLPLIAALGDVPVPRTHPRPPRKPLHLGSKEAIAIGCSTGGPNALMEVIPRLPGQLKVPVFIVQHMPPKFTEQLAKRLDGLTKLTVVEAEHGARVKAGWVYIAKGGYHMRVVRRGGLPVIELDEGPPVQSCRPAVDVLFESLAETYGEKVAAAVLTGMGRDGSEGARKLKAAGAALVAQTLETCVVASMPRGLIEAELADQIGDLTEIPAMLSRYVA